MSWKKYFYTFLITLLVFVSAIYLSKVFDDSKINKVKNIESKIYISILASETQYDLMGEVMCDSTGDFTLSGELSSLGDRLNYLNDKLTVADDEFITLKKYYSVLQIKDYLLSKKHDEKCKTNSTKILYFYSDDCSSCEAQGNALTALHRKYSDMRVYSFDYDLDLPLIKTLSSIYGVTDELPAIVINGKLQKGFINIDEMEAALPAYLKATTTATSTKAR